MPLHKKEENMFDKATKLPDSKLRPWCENQSLDDEFDRQMSRFERTIVATIPMERLQGQSVLDIEDLHCDEAAEPEVVLDPFADAARKRREMYRENVRWFARENGLTIDVEQFPEFFLDKDARGEDQGGGGVDEIPDQDHPQHEQPGVTEEERGLLGAVPIALARPKTAEGLTQWPTRELADGGLASDPDVSDLVRTMHAMTTNISTGMELPSDQRNSNAESEFNAAAPDAQPSRGLEDGEQLLMIDIPKPTSLNRTQSEPSFSQKLAKSKKLAKAAQNKSRGYRKPGSAKFLPRYDTFVESRPATASTTVASTRGLQAYRDATRNPSASWNKSRPRSPRPSSASSVSEHHATHRARPSSAGMRGLTDTLSIRNCARPQSAASSRPHSPAQGMASSRETGTSGTPGSKKPVPDTRPLTQPALSPVKLPQRDQVRTQSRPVTPSERRTPVSRLLATGPRTGSVQDTESQPEQPGEGAVGLDDTQPGGGHRRTLQHSATVRSRLGLATHDDELRRRKGLLPLPATWKPQTFDQLDPDRMRARARDAIVESKRVNSRDSTWDVLQQPMNRETVRELWRSESKLRHHFNKDFQDALDDVNIFPEYKLKMDGLRKWGEEAIKGNWKIFG